MRLKKIRLAGFKSFVDPTNIPFPGDMTAIVGPNGCGKSNVIDAVRWVLGESSAKNLRGDAMTDVIFNGSSARKPVSQCSVELVFDNSSGRIQGEFAAFNEISVKRVVTKDAVSSYHLNSAKCRRKDITDLFLGTGLGPRSYAIIEQGMISKLIESKPQELRVFIEEAAGISKYKERRKETKTRIAHTKENLDRLEDVRQELGDNIAKLKRQAAAATRYKELKQQERQLKAELSTIKWLAQSKIMDEAQIHIDDAQQSLDQLIAGQQGDESGLQALKNNQSIAKQEIDDVQQHIFSLGNEITKLEQSQLFAKKRISQIQAEIEQIKQSESSLYVSLKGVDEELEQNQQRLADIEPEKEILEEQLIEIENRKLTVDERLQAQLNSSKQKEDAYYQKKQALQQKHSQIQQTLSLQARSETRLNELRQELVDLIENDFDTQLEALELSLRQLDKDIDDLQNEQNKAKEHHMLEKSQFNEAEQTYASERERLTNISAKLDALIALQKDTSDSANDKNDYSSDMKKQAVWEYFKVKAGAEKMLNAVLRDLGNSDVVDATWQDANFKHWPENAWQEQSKSLLLSQHFTKDKAANSLADLLSNEYVPQIFNYYVVADDVKHALSIIDTLKAHQKIVTLDGLLFSYDSFISPQKIDNKFLRAAQIESLAREKEVASQAYEKSQIAKTEAQQSLQNAQESLQTLAERLNMLAQQKQSTLLSQSHVQQQQAQYNLRSEKLLTEINEAKEQLEQEAMSLELLNEQVEDLSIEVMELEAQKEDTSATNEELRQQQQSLQAQQNQMQSKVHEQALLIQQIRNSLQILQEQKRSKSLLLNDNQEKLKDLQEEAEDLLLPEHQQQEKLQDMLQKQEEFRELLTMKQDVLAQIEQEMREIEKGQHGLNARIDKIKSEIESHRIRLESAKVRAQSYIEQLSDSEQSVKEILAHLSDEADEKQWQEELDKASSSIQRLGAVNLAAVDEYEEQSKRKENLDAQNTDLSQALETLEAAMRKIDKETRSRFKATFDQVNDDLKTLFPKVFGGGMAYLELTDDDMLDTGVTIMARPPGKKNSTIHLLSGGEKALTALSLVFAIFRLNPAPFCLLDEVDAPLDDANVGRFCRLVSQMSETVQFIYITHNKVAMEMASHLTGVTMAEPGVSRMVAVDMEQALAIAE